MPDNLHDLPDLEIVGKLKLFFNRNGVVRHYSLVGIEEHLNMSVRS